MVTDKQVRRLFAMKNKVKYLYQLADKTGTKHTDILNNCCFGSYSSGIEIYLSAGEKSGQLVLH